MAAYLIFLSYRYLDTVKFRALRSFFNGSPSPWIVLIVNIAVSLAFFLGGWILVFILNLHNFSKKELRTLVITALFIFIPFGITATHGGWFDAVSARSPLALLKAYDRDDISLLREYREDAFVRDNPLYLYLMATGKSGSGDVPSYRRIASLLQRALAGGYESAAVYNNLGNAMLMLDSAEQSLAHYERALSAAPGDPVILYNISQYYLFRDDYDTAKIFYDKAFASKGQLDLPVLDWENIVLLEKKISPAFVWNSFLKDTARWDFPVKSLSFSKLAFFPAVSVILLVLMLLLYPLTANWSSFVRCESCGIPIIPGSATTSHRGRIFCSRCHLMLPVFLNQKAGRHSMATKIDYLKTYFINLIYPGSGYIIRGATVTGLVWLFLTTSLITTALFSRYFLVSDLYALATLNELLLFYPVLSLVSTALLPFYTRRFS
jgi:tetratricopeptide (TPR) repeat protein